MIKDFESGSRYETLLALCYLPKRDTRDHARRSWHIFAQLLHLEHGEKIKGTSLLKTLEVVRTQLIEGFRVLSRNRSLSDDARARVRDFVLRLNAAQHSEELLAIIDDAIVWFKDVK